MNSFKKEHQMKAGCKDRLYSLTMMGMPPIVRFTIYIDVSYCVFSSSALKELQL